MAYDALMADCFIAYFAMRSFGLVYLHHHRKYSPFLAIAFLGRFCPIKIKSKAIPVTGREGP
jgi:hypothetical protein